MFQAFLTARHTPLITCCACAARWCAGGAATCTATSQPSCCSSARLRVLLLQGRLSRSRAWARRSGLRQRGGGPMRAGRYCACTFSRTGERRERTRWHSGTRCGAALADKSCGLLAGAPVGCFDKQASGFESSACLPLLQMWKPQTHSIWVAFSQCWNGHGVTAPLLPYPPALVAKLVVCGAGCCGRSSSRARGCAAPCGGCASSCARRRVRRRRARCERGGGCTGCHSPACLCSQPRQQAWPRA